MLSHRKSNKYLSVNLFNGHGASVKYVHRIVAEAFHGCPQKGMDVNHIDGDKRNNRAENLEWRSRSDNLKHSYVTGLRKPSGGYPIRPIRVLETGIVYPSVRECARNIGADHRHIHKCLKGQYKQHKGFHYEYADECEG